MRKTIVLSLVLMFTSISVINVEAQSKRNYVLETRDISNFSVRSGRLYVSQKSKVKKIKPITLHIGIQELDKIILEGGINLLSDIPLKAETLDVEVAGGINVDLEVNTNYLNIEAEGGVNIALCGVTEKADIELIGAGNLNAFCLAADEMDLDIEGAGKANVNVINNLEISAEGVATIKYKGNPEVEKDLQGIASVRRVD